MIWIGTYIGLAVRTPDAVMGVGFIVVFPLTFLSNAFVPISSLPTVLQWVAAWNPVSVVVAAIREMFGNPTAAGHQAHLAARPPGARRVPLLRADPARSRCRHRSAGTAPARATDRWLRSMRLVGDTAARLLFRPATVAEVTEHDGFRTIELVGEKLVGADWHPGDKVRIHLDGLTLRTYTPIAWDQTAGSTSILAYLPGDGPGSEWCAQAKTGDACSLFGPQRSVRLDELAAPPIIVGDETSFGLTVAWHNLHPDEPPAATLFEVTRTAPAGAVLAGFGVTPTALVERTADDGHLGP